MSDDLTGALSRADWVSLVAADMSLGATGNVILCDVDRLTEINAEYGHAVGDLVLAEVARILGRHGMAGRVGGDEFAVWLAGDFVGAATAEQIVAEVSRVFAQRGAFGVSVSVGVTRGGDSVPAALERAEQALRIAKSAGRERACCADLAA